MSHPAPPPPVSQPHPLPPPYPKPSSYCISRTAARSRGGQTPAGGLRRQLAGGGGARWSCEAGRRLRRRGGAEGGPAPVTTRGSRCEDGGRPDGGAEDGGTRERCAARVVHLGAGNGTRRQPEEAEPRVPGVLGLGFEEPLLLMETRWRRSQDGGKLAGK
jgi:hypothetical protein